MSITPIPPGRFKPPGYYIVNMFKSNVIGWERNFSRGPPGPAEIYDNERLRGKFRCGRIWVDGPIFYSQPEFGKWYERIARWLNKNYGKIDEVIRAGPTARALWEQVREEGR